MNSNLSEKTLVIYYNLTRERTTMALLGLKNIFKICQANGESIIFNSRYFYFFNSCGYIFTNWLFRRMISLSNIKMNTVEKEKTQTPSPDFSDQKSVNETNPELEKLNEQILDLTSKNTELIVCIEYLHVY